MTTDKELLEDILFDREIAPRDRESDVLMLLLKAKSFDKDSATLYYHWDILKEEKELKKRKIIKIKKHEKHNLDIKTHGKRKYNYKIWLTPKGKIIAFGEYSIRQREEKNESNKKNL